VARNIFMTKPITGQYEYQHSSGVGLDYFTSRIDRLTILPNGRFTLIIQERSRLANAAQSLLNGQQVAANAPETRHEGSYTAQDNTLSFRFDNGPAEQGQVSWNGDGLQFGPNFFTKVSDSTMLPPTHRLKKDMDDIAKGLKIASAIGGMAVKAVKTVQDTIQTTQESTPPPAQNATPPATPQQPSQSPQSPPPVQPTYTPPVQQAANPGAQRGQESLFCDQCGARVRPGKRFCNNCGAQLP
jgi:hypothetical protein